MRVYHGPLGPEASRALLETFADLTGGAEAAPASIALRGRSLQVPKAARGVAWFDFADLCEKPLGAADYLALARTYHTVLIEGVPVMTEARRNEDQRFMTLIAALYEHQVTAVIRSEERHVGTECIRTCRSRWSTYH